MVISGLTLFTACNQQEEELSPVADKTTEVSLQIENQDAEDLAMLEKSALLPTDSLTPSEIEGLMYLREEEKMAHDLYRAYFLDNNLHIFKKIALAERKHMKATRRLINFYGLTDPAIQAAGQFSDTTIQAMYDALLADGLVSPEDALNSAAYVEESDILDLMNELSATSNTNLIFVYSKLLNGSKRHLKGLVHILDNYGIVYQPQLLDSTLYNDIINMTWPAPPAGN